MKFIDLFSGIGGFHKALHGLGHKCVFASEIDPVIQTVYEKTWGLKPYGDIKKIVKENIDIIPEHDILCAGFPCQPFSKAGKQEGRDDEERGTLFRDIAKILEFRKPKYFILENVPFIKQHDNEATWRYMENHFKRLKYKVDHSVYSPHDFGVPQHRKRIFIVGSLDGLAHFSFKDIDKQRVSQFDIQEYIEENSNGKKLPQKNIECLKVWQEFIEAIPAETKLPGFPIWSMEFGATYPYESTIPFRMKIDELAKYKGSFGAGLKGMNRREQFAMLPSYARVEKKFPDWKQRYIRQNRSFYAENVKYIEGVMKKIEALPSQSWQKLEWNVGNSERQITDYILQFRASGIRVKKVDFFPSLVCTNTQIPIIGWKQRYISREEGMRLQSLEGVSLPENDNAAFKALGNAVNSMIIRIIAEKLLHQEIQLPETFDDHRNSIDLDRIMQEDRHTNRVMV